MSDRFSELYSRVLEDSDSVTGDELRELLALNAVRERAATRAAERQKIFDEIAAVRAQGEQQAEADRRRGADRIRHALNSGTGK